MTDYEVWTVAEIGSDDNGLVAFPTESDARAYLAARFRAIYARAVINDDSTLMSRAARMAAEAISSDCPGGCLRGVSYVLSREEMSHDELEDYLVDTGDFIPLTSEN